MDDGITPSQFHEAGGTEDWRVVGDGACAFFATTSFADAACLVEAIAGLPGVEAHRPDVDVRRTGVTVRLLTTADDWYGMTTRDVELARGISAEARRLGIRSDPGEVQSILVIVEGRERPSTMPFWQAVLGYDRRPDSPAEDLVDPRDRGPAVWFEDVTAPQPNGDDRIHVAVWVPFEQADARLAAAIAAGGRVIRDQFAPSSWTLVDAEGHEVDIATVKGRD